jgi:lysophospholipase L1-like esterase
MKPGRSLAVPLLVLGSAAAAVAVALADRLEDAQEVLRRRIATVARPGPGSMVPCERLRALQPLVLLVLGQSNAANHGLANGDGAKVPVISAAGTCHLTGDPLPGGTGGGRSIWSHLQAAIDRQPGGRPVVFGVLAVDATRMADWSDPDGPLAPVLKATVAAMQAARLAPDLVLWQHGEADARAGTDPNLYVLGLTQLAERLAAQGVRTPWVLAQSTVCRSPPAERFRTAVQALVASDVRFRRGPDTDSLGAPEHRFDGCHFSRWGLQRAAEAWAEVLFSVPSSPPTGR